MSDYNELDEQDQAWVDKMTEELAIGKKLVADASDEAAEYIKDVMDNVSDRAWRKMVVETQSVEMGAGIAMVEVVADKIYKRMRKRMHKDLHIPRQAAEILYKIYIGRVVKNVVREINARNQ